MILRNQCNNFKFIFKFKRHYQTRYSFGQTVRFYENTSDGNATNFIIDFVKRYWKNKQKISQRKSDL